MPHHVTFSKRGLAATLWKLSQRDDPEAATLFTKVVGGWGNRLDRTHITACLDENEYDYLLALDLPKALVTLDVVKSAQYLAVYRDDTGDTDAEVTVRSRTRPPKWRTLKAAGGPRKLKLVSSEKLPHLSDEVPTNTKENTKMARKTAKKAPAELDELEGLEELDDLEDLDVPDIEEDEDEAPAPKRRSRSKKAAPVEEDDDDDAEDDDEEDEEPSLPTTLKGLRTLAREKGITGAGKMSKEDLIEAIEALDLTKKTVKELRALAKEAGIKGYGKMGKDDLIPLLEGSDDEDEDEEDDEEEVEEAPKKAAKKTAAKKSGKGPTPPVRELPSGKQGADAIAKAAGVEARDVRVFLRKLGDDAKEKYFIDGRWAFNAKQVELLAKKLKASKKG